jgi:hypothetical protein
MEECREGEIPVVEMGGRKVACLLYSDRGRDAAAGFPAGVPSEVR